MPVNVEVIRACEFVRMGTEGEFDLESTRAAIMTLAEACHKRGVERALIDVRGSTSNLTPNDLATLVTAFCEGVPRRLRMAILHTGGQNYRVRLFAFFSAMRGRPVRAFENFEEALEWISKVEELGEVTPEEEVPIQSKDPLPARIAVQGESQSA